MAAPLHVVVGAGPVGSALALRLAAAGDAVRVITRSGGGPEHPSIERVAADASDAAALTRLSEGATVLYNCANPGSYTQWERLWPPLAASLLTAAEATGAVLAITGNLYGYGRVHGAILPQTPLAASDHKGELRARMWQDALAAHRQGRVRVVEVRSSDYIGPTLPTSSGIIARYAAATLADRTAPVFADPDQPHSWTDVDDVARTLAVVGGDERAWGDAWLVPTNPPATVREVLRQLGARVGAREPRLRRVPRWTLRAGGLAVPLLREVVGVLYQFDRPFVLDSRLTTETFGLEPTPWDDVVGATARAWHERAVRG